VKEIGMYLSVKCWYYELHCMAVSTTES